MSLIASFAIFIELDESLVRSSGRRAQEIDIAWSEEVGECVERDVILVDLL